MTIEAAVFAVSAAGLPSLSLLGFCAFRAVLQHLLLGPASLYFVFLQ